ncbi:uncharacterized protein EV154DRAFT_237291 [Mucor mucedo]|uniref:uncharacterized protein n=1 Tax=Mucor mucedo TaxID=29922 RepID=UPI00221F4796|nr:uncharacterized protein EV154DRAFT_237291 [Mucor mucedo]KAI7896408.1 hypothetical protein EV154DRAFT_237291 [Mucor mucedo]
MVYNKLHCMQSLIIYLKLLRLYGKCCIIDVFFFLGGTYNCPLIIRSLWFRIILLLSIFLQLKSCFVSPVSPHK